MNEKILSIVIRGKNEASSAFRSVDDDMSAVAKRSEQLGGLVSKAAMGMAVATVAGTALAVKSYGDYESSLSKLQQATQGTAAEMESMNGLARSLGRDTSLAGVSASDAALSMVELAKAGLTVNDTMAASRGVLALAKAGNIDFAAAATIAASALNAFGMEGADASKVADSLAAGANASQAELMDLALGMQQSATVAKQFKLSLNDNVTALALFANNGIKGSDAGTSLKTMLISLASPSDTAAAAMKKIGFNAYDAQGNFIGLREMSIQLKKSLEGLTEQKKQDALATIFGTDAFRAAAVMADNAGTSYDNMAKAVGRNGAAQDAARAQLGAYERAMEALGNSISDVSLTVGQRFAPAATSAANALSSSLGPALNTVDSFLKTFGPALLGVAAGWGAYQLAVTGAAVATGIFSAAQTALAVVMAANPVGLLAIALVGVTTAFIASTQATDNNTAANDKLAAAQDRVRLTSTALMTVQEQLRQAKLQEEAQTLAVERAQLNYNNAVAQYGPTSLEAREASNALAQSKNSLGTTVKRVSDLTAEETVKTRESAAAAKESMVAAQGNMAAFNGLQTTLRNTATAQNNTGVTFDAVTGKVIAQKNNMDTLRARLDSINGRTFNYTLAQQLTSSSSTKTEGRATGGPVRAGTPYVVGENADGSLNSTSELFVPSSNGRIFNAKDLRDALSGGSSGGPQTVFNMHGDIHLDSADAVDRFRERFANISELGQLGVGV